MNKGIVFVAIAILCGAFLISGCAKKTCETIEDACGGGQKAIDECIDDYKDGDSDCKKALRNMADCVEDKGCDERCASEMLKVINKC